MKKCILTLVLGVMLASQNGCCRVNCFLQRLSCRLRPCCATTCYTLPASETHEQSLAAGRIDSSDLIPPAPPMDEE